MNLWLWLKAKFTDPPPLLDEAKSEALQALVAPLIKPSGRVVKHTRSVEYKPDDHRHGGRIVKVMPRNLQRIKEAQEEIDDVAL